MSKRPNPNPKEKNDMVSKLMKIASLILILGMLFSFLAACGGTAATTQAPAGEEAAEPSNPGGPGEAINLTGDATAGATVYTDQCAKCHGDQGKGGVENPGSDDGTVPPLNPIDSTMVSSDYKTFATNIDLFIEHGSTPEGENPAKVMTAFGDQKVLTPQQIADVIAYVISLNK
jgi:mono/diheme cytochrome c family protein